MPISVTCECGRELSFADQTVRHCPDCGQWVVAPETVPSADFKGESGPGTVFGNGARHVVGRIGPHGREHQLAGEPMVL